MTSHTTKQAAKTYETHSVHAQEKTFQNLISYVDIQHGWKILDLGCGTGNNTSKLAQMVGSEGRVIGIDPINERIDVAREKHAGKNIEFHAAFGQDASNYAQDCDLVVAGEVLHWVSLDEKMKLFKEVFQCLKPGGVFLFSSMISPMSCNWSQLFLILWNDKSIKENALDLIYCHNTGEWEEIAGKSGFLNPHIECQKVVHPFDDVRQNVEACIATAHFVNYDSVLQHAMKIVNDPNRDCSFLYDSGRPVYTNNYQYIICKKSEIQS